MFLIITCIAVIHSFSLWTYFFPIFVNPKTFYVVCEPESCSTKAFTSFSEQPLPATNNVIILAAINRGEKPGNFCKLFTHIMDDLSASRFNPCRNFERAEVDFVGLIITKCAYKRKSTIFKSYINHLTFMCTKSIHI